MCLLCVSGVHLWRSDDTTGFWASHSGQACSASTFTHLVSVGEGVGKKSGQILQRQLTLKSFGGRQGSWLLLDRHTVLFQVDCVSYLWLSSLPITGITCTPGLKTAHGRLLSAWLSQLQTCAFGSGSQNPDQQSGSWLHGVKILGPHLMTYTARLLVSIGSTTRNENMETFFLIQELGYGENKLLQETQSPLGKDRTEKVSPVCEGRRSGLENSKRWKHPNVNQLMN